MHHRRRAVAGVFALALMIVAGCGGGGNDAGGFKDCGNGVLDAGEECDDGNLSDNDGCLSTCKLNVCGDFFINEGVEQCEQAGGLGGMTCRDVGFADGTLACTTQCTFDTSRCTGTVEPPTPTPAATPSAGGGTSTPAEPSGITTPTAGPTPVAGTCDAGDQVVVVVSLDKPYGAASINLVYPASVTIPGTGTDPTVVARVTFAASGGLTAVNDSRVNADVDDTLTASFVGFTAIPAGTFVTVTFDCGAGEAPPTAAEITCTVVSASAPDGGPITDEQCTVTVQ